MTIAFGTVGTVNTATTGTSGTLSPGAPSSLAASNGIFLVVLANDGVTSGTQINGAGTITVTPVDASWGLPIGSAQVTDTFGFGETIYVWVYFKTAVGSDNLQVTWSCTGTSITGEGSGYVAALVERFTITSPHVFSIAAAGAGALEGGGSSGFDIDITDPDTISGDFTSAFTLMSQASASVPPTPSSLTTSESGGSTNVSFGATTSVATVINSDDKFLFTRASASSGNSSSGSIVEVDGTIITIGVTMAIAGVYVRMRELTIAVADHFGMSGIFGV